MKKQALWLLLFCAFSMTAQNRLVPYKNSRLSTDERVKDLLGRMNAEEKVAQMLCHWESQASFRVLDTLTGEVNEALLAKRAPHGLGEVARPSEGRGTGMGKGPDAFATATLANKIQKYFVEKTRLGIPVMFHEEGLHGNQSKDATVFPTHLALGSTWNEPLLGEIYTKVAEEVRLRGGHHVLAPVVDLGRDPRWGRTEETLGEDPYHVSRMAVAEIAAYQGGMKVDKIPAKHVISTLKHFGCAWGIGRRFEYRTEFCGRTDVARSLFSVV
jgi:beta-glucosidase